MSTFAKRLQEAREKMGYSQTELARLVGITPQAVSFAEHGKTCSPRNLEKFSAILKVSREWLMFGKNEGEVNAYIYPVIPFEDLTAEIELKDYQSTEFFIYETKENIVGISNSHFFKNKLLQENIIIVQYSDFDLQNGEIYLIENNNYFYFKEVVFDVGEFYLKNLFDDHLIPMGKEVNAVGKVLRCQINF